MKRIADLLRNTKNWMLGHKLRAVILALVLVFTAPWPARAQIISPCCALLVAGLSSIQSALTKVVGGGLNQILGVDKAMQQFQQPVVSFPDHLLLGVLGHKQSAGVEFAPPLLDEPDVVLAHDAVGNFRTALDLVHFLDPENDVIP